MRINDTETAEVARQNRADDEAMAQKIDSNLPRPTLGPKKASIVQRAGVL